MSVTTFSFAFMLIIIFIYYICRKELRLYILGASGLTYAFLVSFHTGMSILLITLFTYLCALLLYHIKHRLINCVIFISSLIVIIASLVYFKYFNSTLLAIGYSFFCFQAIGYLVDIYRRQLSPIYNPLKLLVFYAWFPKLVSGPIERADQFIAQLNKLQNVSLFDKGRIKKSISYIFVGCFYKLVLADRFQPIVDGIFDMPHIYQTTLLIMGVLLYTIQIYCDFAGYSMIAIGVSNIFGIELTENFCSPYLATSISDFWKRWHISLTSWLRDYIYIPLGGNRKGQARLYINLLIVFIISGLWHGNGIGFLVWGLLHGLLSIVDKILQIRNKILGWLCTFISVSFVWMFFKAATAERICAYIIALFANNNSFPISAQLAQLGVDSGIEVIIAATAFIIIMVIDLAIKKYHSLDKCINSISLGTWCCFMWIIIISVVILGIYGPAFEEGRMIYMQF